MAFPVDALQEVLQVRQQQIAYKKHLREIDAQERELEKLEVREKVQAYEMDKYAADEERFIKNKLQQLEVQSQMAAKQAIRATAEDEKRREKELAQKNDQQYMAVVGSVFETQQPKRSFGRPRVNWYT